MFAFLAKIGIGSIVGQIAEAYTAKQNATTEQERIAADERIKMLEAKRDVLVAESASGGPASWIRPLFALPFVIYIWKLVIWDKVLAAWTGGSTDALSPELSDIMMLVIGGYFLGRTAEKVTRIVKRK